MILVNIAGIMSDNYFLSGSFYSTRGSQNVLGSTYFCTPFLKKIIFYGRIYEALQLPVDHQL